MRANSKVPRIARQARDSGKVIRPMLESKKDIDKSKIVGNYALDTKNHWRRKLEGLELAHVLVDTILDKKGGDIVLIDISDEAIFTDYFLICNGENDRQLSALAESIADDAKKKANIIPWGTEGEPRGGWVLLDYGDLIVHLFSPEMRDYYNLEELWNRAHIVLRLQ